MDTSDRIRLLVANQDEHESTRLISMLESAGISLRPQYVHSAELLEKLSTDQAWDLCIIDADNEALSYREVLQGFRKQRLDIPTLVLCHEEDHAATVIQALKLGAVDTIKHDHDQHLIAVVKREFDNRQHRQLRRQAELKQQASDAKAAYLLDDLRTPTAYLQDGMFLYSNSAFLDLFKFEDEDDLIVTPIAELVPDAKHQKQLSKLATGEDAAEQKQLNTPVTTSAGESFDAVILVRTTEYDGEACNEIVIPSHRLNFGEQIIAATEFEMPTLMERRQFIERTQQAMSDTQDGKRHQLCYFEAPDYSEATNPFDLGEREQLIEQIASYLKDNYDAIGSWGNLGDGKFCLISQYPDETTCLSELEVVIAGLDKQVWECGSKSTRLHLRAGICQISNVHDTVDDLLAAAREAQSAAVKLSEVAAIFEFADDAQPELTTDDIIARVKSALADERFKLLFQPIINIHGNTQELYEVLLRLIDEDGNEVSPAEWREQVAKSGLGALIDRWVIRESAKKLALHLRDGHDTKLLINLSEAALNDDGLPAFLGSLFNAAGLPRESLVMQLSEKDVNRNLKSAAKLTESLAGLQCHAALTHFGSSLNPFETLNHLIIDWVKVDGSYTKELQEGGDTKVLQTLLTRLHDEERETIIPMVENAAIINKLWQSGAKHIQGYYVQSPSDNMAHDFELY
ncbi:MAG: EAL domain-containing protein [Pseudomonadales bacterium]|jgi:EAL domain-containing protein (putative c-di-GMP-specific phosphodiesterase class I)/DNA-binding NarL/FixJ family response regulator/GGDEF domain-containing protein